MIELKDIPVTNRMNAMAELCKTKNYKQPQKREVAIGILELKSEGRDVLCPEYIDSIKELHRKITVCYHENS